MTEVCLHTFVSPLCCQESREETRASLWIRIAIVSCSIIGISVGILILYKIPGLNQLGTTTGKVMIPMGIFIIGACAALKCVKAPITSTSEPHEEAEVTLQKPLIQYEAKLPVEIWKVIFSWLKPEDLLTCQVVCKNWVKLANDDEVWKVFCSRNVGDFSVMVEKNLFSWKKVYFRYSKFSYLFSKIIEKHVCGTNQIITHYNPQLKSHTWPSHYLLHFFVHYGQFRFFIKNLTEVLVQKNQKEYCIFKDQTNQSFTHLTVEKEMVFALRKDGIICQWNYLTGKRIQDIETAASKKDAHLNQVFQQVSNLVKSRDGFAVKEGYLFLNYGDGDRSICEVITYANPEQRHFINDNDVPAAQQIQIKGNKLYVMGQSTVFVWDLLKQKKINSLVGADNYFWDFTIIQNKLYAALFNSEVRVFDTYTGEQLKGYKLPSKAQSFQHIEKIGSILFGFSIYNSNNYWTDQGTIWAYDLSTEKELGTVDDIINLRTYEIQPHVLPAVIALSQKEFSSQA